MTRVKLIAGGVALLIVAGFLSYSLPSRDIVRILGTEIARTTVESENAQGETVSRSRDVRYIKAARRDGSPVVYRNEDTGWGWPPYFKFDSADLAARADDSVSTEAAPRWMVVRHYGWRATMFSWFPNALSIRPAESMNETLFPWFNVILIGLLAVAALLARRALLRLIG
jgi:hypothetical protein